MNRYLWLYGSSAAGMPLIGIMCKMVVSGVKTSGAVCVTGQVTMSGRLAVVVPVVLGLVPSTWFRRHAWMATSRCVPSILSWSTKSIVTLRGCDVFGSNDSCTEARLSRPIIQGKHPRVDLVVNMQLLCRPQRQSAGMCRHSWQPTVRIGEAKNPGPL
eukprot:4392375-Amphidinium_carterae.1